MENISLASGATYFHTPEPARQAAIAALDQHKTFYTAAAGTPGLRQAIARRYLDHNQVSLDAANILITPGTKQALYTVLQAILRPGDEVLVPVPNWGGLHQVLELLGAKLVALPTALADNYALQPEKLQQLLSHKTRLFLFSNPCNPTCRRYSREELEALLAITSQYPELYIMSDEVYDLVTFGEKVPSLLELPDPNQRHIVVNGFSKSFAMTGWRIGYAVLPPSLLPSCVHFQQVMYAGVSEFVQEAAQAIMENYAALLPLFMEKLRENKDLASKFLVARGILFYPPEAGYYVFPDLAPYLSEELPTTLDLAAWLEQHYHLEILAGDLFGAPGFARLSFGIEKTQLQEALQRLGQALDELQRLAKPAPAQIK
ncbi:MAG: pyridoxal phosphate-dependent aminotransferase [Adhaeribacter sp.]